MDNKDFYIDLANSYIKLADEHYLDKKIDEALIYYQRFNDILEMLYKDDNNDEKIKKDLIKSFSKLGKVYIKLKDYEKALEFYTKENFFKEKNYNNNKIFPDSKNSLANSFYNLGIVHLYLKDNKNSYLNFQKSEKLFKELAESYPNDKSYLESLNDVIKLLKRTAPSKESIEKNKIIVEKIEKEKEKVVFEKKDNTNKFQEEKSMIIDYQTKADIYNSEGSFHEAIKYYKKANKIIKDAYNLNQNDFSLRADLAVSYESLGDAYLNLNDIDNALFYYEKVNKLFKKLYKENQDDIIKNGLAISYVKIGELLASKAQYENDYKNVLKYYNKTTSYLEELSTDNKYNNEYKSSLSIVYSSIGDIYKGLDDLYKALEFYKKSTAFFELLYNYDRTNLTFKHDLAISYSKLGELYTVFEDYNNALDVYTKEMELYKSSYQFDNENLELKTDLALSYQNIGDCYTSLCDLDKALAVYKKYNSLMIEAYEIDKSINIKFGLTISYDRLGVTYTNLKENEKGLKFSLIHLKMIEEIYNTGTKEFPNIKSDFALSYYNVGVNYHQLDKPAKAIENFTKSKNMFKELITDHPRNKKFKKDLEDTNNYLALLLAKEDGSFSKEMRNLFKEADLSDMNDDELIELYNNIQFMNIKDYKLLIEIGDFYKKFGFIKNALYFYNEAQKYGASPDEKISECNKILENNIKNNEPTTSSDIKKNIENKKQSQQKKKSDPLKKVINFEEKKEKKIQKELYEKRTDKNRVQIVHDSLKIFIDDYSEKEKIYNLDDSEKNMLQLALSYQKTGDQYHKIADDYNILEFLFSGIKVYKKSNKLFKKLYLFDKENKDSIKNLETSYNKLKLIYEVISRYYLALEDYDNLIKNCILDNDLKKEVYKIFNNDFTKYDLVVSYYDLANIYREINKNMDSIYNIKISRVLIDELINKYPSYDKFNEISEQIDEIMEYFEL